MSLKRRGFIYTRTLIALFITVSLLPLAVSVFRFAADLHFDYDRINSELALMDLRRVLLLAYDLNVGENELRFIYHDDDYTLGLVNGRLTLQPGTQMYLDEVGSLRFYTKEGVLYVSYITKEGREYERIIAKEKGIHLDDFLIDNDELSDIDDGDV